MVARRKRSFVMTETQVEHFIDLFKNSEVTRHPELNRLSSSHTVRSNVSGCSNCTVCGELEPYTNLVLLGSVEARNLKITEKIKDYLDIQTTEPSGPQSFTPQICCTCISKLREWHNFYLRSKGHKILNSTRTEQEQQQQQISSDVQDTSEAAAAGLRLGCDDFQMDNCEIPIQNDSALQTSASSQNPTTPSDTSTIPNSFSCFFCDELPPCNIGRLILHVKKQHKFLTCPNCLVPKFFKNRKALVRHLKANNKH